MFRIFLVWLLLAVPAYATQDQWPALFDVTDVASDDVLNVRDAPGTGGSIIASLAYNSEGVEVIRPSDRQDWGLVNTREGTGWVSLAFLRRQPGQWLGAEPAIRRCSATEPSWSLDLDGPLVTFATPEEEFKGSHLDSWRSENRRDAHAFSFRLSSQHADARDGVGITTLAQCFDGMSDREYGLRIDMILGTLTEQQLLSGCCSLQAP